MFPPTSSAHDVYFDGDVSNSNCSFTASPGSAIANNVYFQDGYSGDVTLNPGNGAVTFAGDLTLSSTNTGSELIIGASDTVNVLGDLVWSGGVSIDASDNDALGSVNVVGVYLTGDDKYLGAHLTTDGDSSINMDWDTYSSEYCALTIYKGADFTHTSGELTHTNGKVRAAGDGRENTLVKNGSDGTWVKPSSSVTVISTEFENSGTLEILDGSLNFNGDSLVPDLGQSVAFYNAPGATLEITAGATLNVSGYYTYSWTNYYHMAHIQGTVNTVGAGTAYLYATGGITFSDAYIDLNGAYGYGTLDCGADAVTIKGSSIFSCTVDGDTNACDVLQTTGTLTIKNTGNGIWSDTTYLDLVVDGTESGSRTWEIIKADTGSGVFDDQTEIAGLGFTGGQWLAGIPYDAFRVVKT